MNAAQKSRVSRTFLRFTLNINTFFLIHSSRFLVQLVFMAADLETHSSSSSSSTSFSARYDVFLSFRGEDTRTSFTDHLYAALRGAGIRTFRDNEELRHGEEIGPELLKAIKESRISIPVFSENYAFSKWCLKELAHIMERKKTDGQIVLPIFYKVDPSNVRNPTERFEEAFREQPEETVDSWKKALREAGNLKGECDTRYSGESELINSVVKTVWSELNKTVFDVAKHPVEIDSRVKEVLRLLHVESKDVRFMVIHGMGGIGKTTIAKAVYNKFFCDFKKKSFIADVRDTAARKGLVQLQKNLLGDIFPGIDADIRSEGEGIKVIKQRCHEIKVLIILDDVDNKKELNALAGGLDWFGPSSKIIITSRNMDVLNADHGDKCIIYQVKELNDRQSLRLFSRHAFGTDEPQQNFMDLSNKLISKVGGLPLALESLGSSLYGYTKLDWESKLKRLNKIPDTDIQKILEFSYDGLNEFDRAIFLDIACFLIGMDKKTIIHILGGESSIGIEMLVRKSLVKIDGDNKLRMHDLLQEMGREIVRKEDPKNPEMRSRLWDHNEALNILRESKGTRNIEGLLLDFRDYSKDHCLEIKAFGVMSKLRLLKICHADHVVGKFGHLPRGLKWLSWEGFAYRSITISHLSRGLKWLSWEGFPHRSITISHLEKLAVLDISGSMELSHIKGISGLPLLKELNLHRCIMLQSLPELPLSLIRLNVSGCTSMKRLPNLSNLKNLQDLCLVSCDNLAEIGGLESLESLINLDVTGCPTYFKTLGMIVGGVREGFLQLLAKGRSRNITRFPMVTISRGRFSTLFMNSHLTSVILIFILKQRSRGMMVKKSDVVVI